MKTLTPPPARFDAIRGVTLEERARLVLCTADTRPERVQRAYRRLAKRVHPDRAGGNAEWFQLIGEAYELLMHGTISSRPLLADDRLIVRFIGPRVQPLIDKQHEWEEYERWHRQQFYWDW